MPDNTDPRRRILVAAMDVAAERGWPSLGFADVASRAGVPLADVHRFFPTRPDLLAGVGRLADADVLSGPLPDPADPPRDRLFEVLMARFDALAPFRHGLRAIVRDLPRDPLAATALAPHLGHSMRWMLEAARIDAGGLRGAALASGLSLLWLAVFRVWIDDETADLSRTMAALDARLRRAEGLVGGVLRRRRGSGGSDGADTAAPSD